MNIIAILAALIHVYIFVLESVLWTKPKTRKIFRQSEEAAQLTKPLALNQGFYNLFLSIAIAIGIYLQAPGRILIDYAMASMLAAAIVLISSNRKMLRGALIQGLLPLIYFLIRLLS